MRACVMLVMKINIKERDMEEYKCAMCGGIFEKTTPEEEAKAELKKFFGDISINDCNIICDDCWEIVRPDKQENKTIFDK